MMMSGKDFLKSHILSWWEWWRKDWEDAISCGRAFQVLGQQSGKHDSRYCYAGT